MNIAEDAAGATSAPTAVVLPAAPALTGVGPTISGTPIEDNALVAVPGSWANSPTGFAYQWQDCDSAGINCASIPGATGQKYTLAAADIGRRVRVEVTASNAGGSSPPAASGATTAVPESGPVGLEIDNGIYATNNAHITIQAAWPVGTTSILISNDGGFRTNTETVAPAADIPWKLLQTGSDRLPKTVYVRFLGVGQDDINFTDDIILDETAPTIQSATLTGDIASAASAARASAIKIYRLRLEARDLVVGVCAVATNRRRATRGAELTTLTSCTARGIRKLSRTLSLKGRTAPRYVRVQNSAGDWSRWITISG